MPESTDNVQNSLSDLFTFTNFVKKFPNLFDGDEIEQKRKALYWQLYRDKDNGLTKSGAVVGVGRGKRVVASKYLQWWISRQSRL